ncbi:hypothetical protein BD410DRAFT_459805 [Rickenella mellea]|uniref:Uncharacterized protein n=1 Tax=Rickenella mellea TaxID=50990 RepID=A0A4Y7PUV0_9AGAM|nr:hypothetical protein BD410DRAFT_459805 [Rickenella mellea]
MMIGAHTGVESVDRRHGQPLTPSGFSCRVGHFKSHCEDEHRRRRKAGDAIIQDEDLDEPDLSSSSKVQKLGGLSLPNRSIFHRTRSEPRVSEACALRVSRFSGPIASLGQDQTRRK